MELLLPPVRRESHPTALPARKTFIRKLSEKGKLAVSKNRLTEDVYEIKNTLKLLIGTKDLTGKERRDLRNAIFSLKKMIGEKHCKTILKKDEGKEVVSDLDTLLDALISGRSGLETRDEFYTATLLFWAAHGGREDAAELLLRLGADPNTKATFEERPLHAASHLNHFGVVKLLLKFGAKVNAKDGLRHCTALHNAARLGSLESLSCLGAGNPMPSGIG
jgi:hypothetical protein